MRLATSLALLLLAACSAPPQTQVEDRLREQQSWIERLERRDRSNSDCRHDEFLILRTLIANDRALSLTILRDYEVRVQNDTTLARDEREMRLKLIEGFRKNLTSMDAWASELPVVIKNHD